MKNTQSGFVGIAFAIIIALIAIGGGTYVYTKINQNTALESDLGKATETASSTITANISVRTDSNGNKIPSVVVDQDQLNKAVTEKFNNPSGRNMVIRDGLRNIVSTFPWDEVMSKDLANFENICSIVPDYLNAKAKIWLVNPNTASVNQGLNITLSNYRLSEYKCKSSKEAFIFTVPYTDKDGSQATVCVDRYTSGFGVANFSDLTCTWKR